MWLLNGQTIMKFMANDLTIYTSIMAAVLQRTSNTIHTQLQIGVGTNTVKVKFTYKPHPPLSWELKY